MSVLVTGVAGFIGYHVATALLDRSQPVIGVDNLNSYYDVALKDARLARLRGRAGFIWRHLDVADRPAMEDLTRDHPEIRRVVHLAAQAGVRYSLIDPYTYIRTNVEGQVVVLEAARRLRRLDHLVYASSSSVYGANTRLPFAVGDTTDHPVSLYAASKKAGEVISDSYARLYGLPLTGLRLFTVYGPWGRPDMAAYIFTRRILEGEPIELFNGGHMRRDFTFVEDVVAGILGCLDTPPPADGPRHRLYNLGNHRSEELLRFVAVLEQAIGRKALVTGKPMQPGDVPATYADIEPARRDFGFEPRTPIDDGLPRFVDWYRAYHGM